MIKMLRNSLFYTLIYWVMSMEGDVSLIKKLRELKSQTSFTDNINLYHYEHPSKAYIKVNEDVLERILNFFGYNIIPHCEYPTIIKSKSVKKRKKIITYGIDETSTRREANKQITTDTSNFKEVTDTKEGKDTTSDFNVLIIQIKNVMRKQFHQKRRFHSKIHHYLTLKET